MLLFICWILCFGSRILIISEFSYLESICFVLREIPWLEWGGMLILSVYLSIPILLYNFILEIGWCKTILYELPLNIFFDSSVWSLYFILSLLIFFGLLSRKLLNLYWSKLYIRLLFFNYRFFILFRVKSFVSKMT